VIDGAAINYTINRLHNKLPTQIKQANTWKLKKKADSLSAETPAARKAAAPGEPMVDEKKPRTIQHGTRLLPADQHMS